MHIFNIVDRIGSPWTLVCPDLNSVCVLLEKLNNDPDTVSYKITDHEGLHIKEVGRYFGIPAGHGYKGYLMTDLNTAIDETISGIEISLGLDGAYWEPLNASIRVLNLVRDLGPNLVGLSEEDFESMLLKAIKGTT